jgi:eukaryotic-like serine/threonine-protein kinase
MQEHVTLVHPEAAPSSWGRTSWLPSDLLEQVRGRVRLLALVLLIGFAVDPVFYFIGWIVRRFITHDVPRDFSDNLGFILADLLVAVASGLMWWVARQGYVSPARLHTIGLTYQILICFQIAYTSQWLWFTKTGTIAPLTWVVTVIVIFPLIMPGPPRRMLVAAILAAATSPLALLLLDRGGKVAAVPDDYLRAFVGPGFSVVLAYFGARMVYGLGREVAAARELGSYSLEERLGEGGMGEVWRARHRMLARPAAIKLIRPSLISPGRAVELQKRFEHEAQVISQLRSPHTVELFDFGVAEEGTFYYVMELLEGLDVDALVRRFGPVPAERAVFLLRQVCHSLAEAEARGLVHRDIKPANIFLCRYGEDYDFVKVLDFGLAKALDRTATGDPGLTRENAVHGTPAYMAPEQAFGEATLDGRADIYATGCVAYWLLTGQQVFTSDTSMGLILHHARTEPVPPSSRTDLPIPPPLERVVLDCLAKDPAARPQTSRELSRRLADVEPAMPWTDERARGWWEQYGSR